MTPELFLQFSDPQPEPALLISGSGTVLAVNRASRDRLRVDALTGRPLVEAVSEPSGEVAKYLRACTRSRQMVIGALTVAGTSCRAEGALLRAAGADGEARSSSGWSRRSRRPGSLSP